MFLWMQDFVIARTNKRETFNEHYYWQQLICLN